LDQQNKDFQNQLQIQSKKIEQIMSFLNKMNDV